MNLLGAEKIIYNADRLVEIKERGDTFPVHMQIGLTEYCCHKCVFCHTEFATADTAKNDTLSREHLIRFLGEAKAYGLKAVTLIGSGEPLLHPEIEAVLNEIHGLGLEIGIFTNGSRISESLREVILNTCTFIRFSVNASCEEDFEKIHRVKNDYGRVIQNIKAIVREKKERNLVLPTIGTQMVFFEDNYRTMADAAKMWREIGADYFEIKPVLAGEGNSVNISVFPARDREDVERKMRLAREYETKDYRVYTKLDQYQVTQKLKERKYRMCYGQALDMNLWADGNLYLCTNMEHEKDIIGNIYEQSFTEIWHGDKRKQRLKEIRIEDCPMGCRGHYLNELIEDYLHPDCTIHPNFV